MNDDNLLQLLDEIRNNNEAAFTKFWNQYFDQVVALARRRLSQQYRRVHDEEDIAVSAIHSFYRGLTAERFRSIESSNELWKILVTLVCRKVAKNIRSQNSQKRGGGNVRGESFLDSPGSSEGNAAGIGNIEDSNGLTPLLEIEFLDTCEKMFEMLEDEPTRNIARLMMEGYNIDEIAEELGCVRRTVERKLKKIREKWNPNSTARN